jgi:hypothetical protein
MGFGIDFAVQCQSGFNGVLHHFLVKDGKSPRLAGTNRTAMGVGLSPEFGGAAAENLGFGCQLNMGFNAADYFIIHIPTPPS